MARLLMVFVVMSIVTGTVSIYFSDCPDGVRKLVEGYDYWWFSCEGILSPFSVINWTLVPDTGPTRQLAVCYRVDNCTLYVDRTTGYVSRYPFSSSIRTDDVPQNVSGTLQCSEVRNNTEETASCRVDVVRVRISSNNIRENGSGSFTCYHAGHSPYTLTWTLTTDTGRTLHLGTCDETKQCTSPHSPAVQLRGYTRQSWAYFNSVQRNMSGTLICSYTYDGFTDTDQTLLDIYHPGTIDKCHIDITSLNWSAVLNCDVSQMFSSAGIYEFEIHQYLMVPNTAGDPYDYVWRQLTGRLSFRHDLSPYINHTDNKQYYRGRLSHSWKLSPDPGINLSFRLDVYSGTHYPTQNIYEVFRIAKPTRPRHNCSDSSYVPEHEVLPCMCTADSLGLPSGRLIWFLGDTVITTGDYGANQILLPSTAVTKLQEPMLAVCMLDWIEPLNATFLWNVALSTQTQTTQTQADTSGFKWATYALGTALGFIAVVVMLIFGRRGHLSRCLCCGPVYDTPEGKRPQRNQSGDSTDLHVYEVVSNTATTGKQSEVMSTGPVYENSLAEQEGHI